MRIWQKFSIALPLIFVNLAIVYVEMPITIAYIYYFAVLIFGAAKSLVGIGDFTLPLSVNEPPITPIFTTQTFSKGSVLALDIHPIKRLNSKLLFIIKGNNCNTFFTRNLILCGSMDCQSFILDVSKPEDIMVQKFEDHSK